MYKSIHRIMILIMLSGSFVLTGCSSSPTSSINPAQPFIVDSGPGDQGPVLKLLTPERKEKIEIFDGQFADGTKILESVVYEWRFNKWNRIAMGQSPYKPGDPVRISGSGKFGILEVIDPNIVNVDYETQKGKMHLSIIPVKSRRFVAYQRIPGDKEYYQISGVSKDGKTIWQLFSEGYWN